MKKILIIAPSWLGDIIMSQSLLKILKSQDPQCSIDVYAPAYTLPILKRMPEIDNYIINPFSHGAFNLKQRFLEGKNLQKQNYDCVFVLPNSLKSALIALFAKIPERRGFKGESRYFILNNMRTNKEDFPRMVERYVALAFDKNKVKSAKDLPLIPNPKLSLKKVSVELLDKLQIKLDRPLLALGCGANYGPSKLWPVENFAEISNKWIEKGGAILALGSKKDAPTVEAIAKNIKANNCKYFYDIAGKTDLTEALDLVGSCTAAICNDSGLMHTVAAADIPQVCIFGSTSTGYTPPLSDKAICLESTAPCHPCFKRTCKFNTYACLKEITPDRAWQALKSIVKI
ncbi:MAG: lipopolysaccharide heptosyltransferase II [Succinatimonas sp.]|nr:lipopolysaccharide heptosyltransferase II [Succinatimonas sp.]